jgi:hypothetical protein
MPELVVLASRRDELDPAATLALDTAQILALAANDKPNQACLNLNGLNVVVLASEGRSVAAAAVRAPRGERLAATAGRIGAVASVAAILAAMLGTPLVPVRVEVITE